MRASSPDANKNKASSSSERYTCGVPGHASAGGKLRAGSDGPAYLFYALLVHGKTYGVSGNSPNVSRILFFTSRGFLVAWKRSVNCRLGPVRVQLWYRCIAVVIFNATCTTPVILTVNAIASTRVYVFGSLLLS